MSNATLISSIEDIITSLGFEIVKININNQVKNIDIAIDSLNDVAVSIGDCTKVSRAIGVIAGVYGENQERYSINISSAGIERPLIKIAHYKRFIGREASMQLKIPINNCKEYRGTIAEIIEKNGMDHVIISQETTHVEVPFEQIKSARLVLTDALFKKLLSGKS